MKNLHDIASEKKRGFDFKNFTVPEWTLRLQDISRAATNTAIDFTAFGNTVRNFYTYYPVSGVQMTTRNEYLTYTVNYDDWNTTATNVRVTDGL